MSTSIDLPTLLGAVPGFAPHYLDLVEAADGDPGVPATLTALADYVAGLAAEVERRRPGLEACLGVVETVAAGSEDGSELVAWAFLDSLAPEERGRLVPWFGPRTRALLRELEPGSGGSPDAGGGPGAGSDGGHDGDG
ncbi:MAG: hypothetical protein ABSG81_16275 [Acidimicrobiales bacterium]|jgi:hypothetical protein